MESLRNDNDGGGRYHDRVHRWCPPMWRGPRCPNFGHTPTTHRGRGPLPLDTMVWVGSKKSFCAHWVLALVWFLHRNTKIGQLPQKQSLNLYKEIYFRKLFLAAHFSQKFEKLSHLLHMGINWTRRRDLFLLLVVVQIGQSKSYALTSKRNEARIYLETVIGAITIKSNLPRWGEALPPLPL